MSADPAARQPQTDEAAPASILVVEDDASVADVLVTALARRGHHVAIATSAASARDRLSRANVDVVLLDLGLPDGDGLELCAELRTWYQYPILIITAEGDEARVVEALDAGADDYITKPFSVPELLARLRVALRHRAVLSANVDPDRLVVGDLSVDTGAYLATAGDRTLDLTPKEFQILSLLARHPRLLVRHSTILSQVWPDGGGSADSLRVHMTKLRKKLGEGPERPRIQTETGVGYRMVPPG
jgi:two-component system KDP operon response regulator KdpE